MNFSTLFRTKENLNLDKNTLTNLRYIAIFGQFLAVNIVYFYLALPFPIKLSYIIIFIGLLTKIIWLIVTFDTPSDDNETLVKLYNKTNPGGPGWNYIKKNNDDIKKLKDSWIVPQGILCMVIGCITIYSALFSTGYFIYGEINSALLCLLITVSSSFLLFKYAKKLIS